MMLFQSVVVFIEKLAFFKKALVRVYYVLKSCVSSFTIIYCFAFSSAFVANAFLLLSKSKLLTNLEISVYYQVFFVYICIRYIIGEFIII